MFEQLPGSAVVSPLIQSLGQYETLDHLTRIALAFFIAWLVYRLSGRLSRRIVHVSRWAPHSRRFGAARQRTLQSLIASTISFVALLAAMLFSIGQFVPMGNLVWFVGLLSAGFGLGARPLISDLLAGATLIFEDSFAVGEKVELLEIEGVVEEVNLRTTWMRAPTGELFIVPNGEVRVIRNFSRGAFSPSNIKLRIDASDLSRAIPLLEGLGREAVVRLPNLVEPWRVISETGILGQHTELTLLSRARFGKAAEMRPHLLALVRERLSESGIELVD